MNTDTPSAGPALDLMWFGAGMAVALAVTGGQVVRTWAKLAIHGTPYGGHYHGLHRH